MFIPNYNKYFRCFYNSDTFVETENHEKDFYGSLFMGIFTCPFPGAGNDN